MHYLIFLALIMATNSCTIYQSPERKTFESESPTFKVQNLQKISCGTESVMPLASQSRLITIDDQISVWEHIINDKSQFESDYLQKEYCQYELQSK
jgi:hypothetical protein